METTVLQVPPLAPHTAARQAAEVLRHGGIVALPTDTVYGLAARADSDDAVRALFAAKRRPDSNPLPILLPDPSALPRAAAHDDARAMVLANAFWPGPLTLVLPRVQGLSDLVTAGLPTVGLRVPDHSLTREVLRACEFLVAVTSANLSGQPPAADGEQVVKQFTGSVGCILDAGPCPGGVPSTVAALEDGHPRILRAGALSLEQLLAALGHT